MERLRKEYEEEVKFNKNRKKILETLLKEALTKDLTPSNRETINKRIKMLSLTMLQIKVYTLFSQHKTNEGLMYFSNKSILNRYEGKIRQKFNVPASISIDLK